MAYRLILAPQAEADLESLIAYIAGDSPEAAGRFLDQFEARVARLSQNPYLGVMTTGFTAIRHLIHYPYLIFYQVDPEARSIGVLRIWHGARNPRSLHL